MKAYFSSDLDSTNSAGEGVWEEDGIRPPHSQKAGWPNGKCSRLDVGKHGSKLWLNHFLFLNY